MAKKRVTLPSDFSEIIERNNIEELKSVFEKCDINAYERGYCKTPALALYGISAEFIRWLVENGADTEAKDSYGRTALYRHSEVYQLEKVKLLLELGADIHTTDTLGNTVLHSAEHHFQVVQFLIKKGQTL
ncbi:MAG: ankyrin repeat domain-containing protein [Moraxella sp.]|nr:ankyrin repeat domain-containing protein [Moraxella sp.]